MNETGGAVNTTNDHGQSEPEKLFDFAKVLTIAHRRRWLILITICLIQLLGLIYTFTRRPIYRSDFTMVVATDTNYYGGSSDSPILSSLDALTGTRSIETQIGIMRSRAIRKSALEKLKAAERTMVVGIDVTSQKDTDLISVVASAYDPQVAASFAEAIIAASTERDRAASTQATRQARKYVERELAGVKIGLAKANESLAAYKRRTGFFGVDVQIQKAAEQLAETQGDFQKAKAEEEAAQKQVAFYAEKLGSQGSTVLENTTFQRNPLFISQLESIRLLQDRRAQVLQEFEPSSREARRVEGEIVDAEKRLRSIAHTIVASKIQARNPTNDKYVDSLASLEVAKSREQSISSFLDERRQELVALPERERGLVELLQDVSVRKRTYEMLSERYYSLLISEQSVLPKSIILSLPEVPASKSYPSHRRNIAMFLMLGILAAGAVAYAAESLDTKIRDETTVAEITGSVALSAIPLVEIEEGKRVIIGDVQHNSAFLEAFRILRNNISFSTIDRPLKLLAVTSAGRSEGKSTTTVNLAVAMAMDGKRVLLVDADLRRPSLHRWMSVSRDIGLTSLVKGENDISSAVLSTGIDNVFVLPSGHLPPNPTEFLNSQRCREVMGELSELYDIVILDCPPCAGLSDVQVIATLVDGVLLVVSIDQTIRPNLYITMHTLEQVNAPVLGFVLNKLDVNRRGYGYYYYYYYYYDYEQDDAKNGGKRSRRRRPLA